MTFQLIHRLFDEAASADVPSAPSHALQVAGEVTYTCRCSMLEIYNESVYDLLNATGEDLDLHLKPRSEEVYVKGLSWEEVRTGNAILCWLFH